MKWTNRLGITAAVVVVATAFTTGAAMASPAATAGNAPASAAASGIVAAPRVNSAAAVGKTVTVTAHKTTEQGLAPAAGPPSITCYVSATSPVGVPQGGSWYGLPAPITSVGGVAYANCTYPVALIEIESALYWQGYLEAAGPTYTYPNRISGTAPSIAGCVPGDWQNVGNLLVIWPPGYGSSTGSARMVTPPVYFGDFDCA